MAHEHGSVGPCMCAQSWYWSSLVIDMFLTLISRDDGNFRMQLNFFRVLCSYSWYLSQASINDRYLDCQWNWAWFFNETIQQNQYQYASGILLRSYHLQFVWSTDFTSSAELDFWQETGETSIKYLISSCCRLIWAVYETFWMKNPNQLVNQCDTQKIYGVLHGRHLTFLCWYWHSWLYLECSQAEICVIITCSAWNHCCLHSNHHSPCLHGFRASRCPQHYLSWCCCTRAYARMISWLNGRLGQYKQLASLSRAIPSSPCSAPEVWVANALTQHVSAMQFFFLRFNYKNSTVSRICMSDL